MCPKADEDPLSALANNRRVIRNALAVLAAFLVVLVAWIVVDRTRGAQNADLHMTAFLVAAVNGLVVGWLMLGRNLTATRRGLCGLGLASAGITLIALTQIDYTAVARSGPVPPTILVAAIVVSLLGGRRGHRG